MTQSAAPAGAPDRRAARMLGIIGGMGPGATADFISKLVRCTSARTDQDHVPFLMFADPRVPDRTEAILNGREEQVLAWLTMAALTLERAGAEGLVIPCNTAHHWLDRLRCRTSLSCLAMPDAVASKLAPALPQGARVALLATRGCWASGVYARAFAARGLALADNPATRQSAVDTIIALVKAGNLDQAEQAMSRLIRDPSLDHAAAVILACSELPIAARCQLGGIAADGLQLVDATEILAQACAEWSLGHR